VSQGWNRLAQTGGEDEFGHNNLENQARKPYFGFRRGDIASQSGEKRRRVPERERGHVKEEHARLAGR